MRHAAEFPLAKSSEIIAVGIQLDVRRRGAGGHPHSAAAEDQIQIVVLVTETAADVAVHGHHEEIFRKSLGIIQKNFVTERSVPGLHVNMLVRGPVIFNMKHFEFRHFVPPVILCVPLPAKSGLSF